MYHILYKLEIILAQHVFKQMMFLCLGAISKMVFIAFCPETVHVLYNTMQFYSSLKKAVT